MLREGAEVFDRSVQTLTLTLSRRTGRGDQNLPVASSFRAVLREEKQRMCNIER